VSDLPLLRIYGLAKRYRLPGGRELRALDGVDLELERGELLALVGESGSGKSTLLNVVAGLESASDGSVEVDGRSLAHLTARQLRALRRDVQMVFQDPYESLDPRQTIGDVVGEPLDVHRLAPDAADRRHRIAAALREVGLDPPEAVVDRRPAELSGGQRQRVAIASALVLAPRLLLADEPVSMLDVSIRAEVLNLLGRLRREHGIAVLMVTHDLATAAAVADRIAVMYLGRVVESGPAKAVLLRPSHPYTRALRDASPVADPRRRGHRAVLKGETPDASALSAGCRFHPRCPRAAARCEANEPDLVEIASGRQVACFFPEENPPRPATPA